ncbi:MAG: hypothetical protein NVS3B18_03330 [Candidatus Dormibacteria bacterium]
MSESSLPRPEVPSRSPLSEGEEPPWRGTAIFEAVTPPGEASPEILMAAPGTPVAPAAEPLEPPAVGDEAHTDEVAAAPAAFLPQAPAAHAAPSRRRRRHRSGVLPSLVPPADIPEDAEGRVVFYVLAPPADTPPPAEPLPEAMAEAEPGPLEETLSRVATAPVRLFLRGGMAGWAPVMLLVVVFLAVFLVGMRLAR